jgi:hypothetical protein
MRLAVGFTEHGPCMTSRPTAYDAVAQDASTRPRSRVSKRASDSDAGRVEFESALEHANAFGV